ncbi:MAG: valine--tRNA ligase [Pelagibacteraceae bacterium]|nr:valine--tRNA ligase [Pelagibacteraceae bacterium]|tara:strand:- start:18313 stop:20961 length:2649 start_codon:yes stop_codon:yes gene_type:complete
MEFKKYNHIEQEKKISDFWIKNGLFKPRKNKSNKKFSIVIPPPNVTGRLHMGHALNNSLQDVLVRFYRMRGLETLWQPGTDHAGIATQAIVEKNLEKKGIKKDDIGREKFIKKIWEWKEESGEIILDQLKKLGCSCDWSRTRFTMDDDLSKAVIKVFVDLYNKNLIYKDKKLVNWDTHLQTAISDLEVVQKDVQSQLYYINYQVESSDKKITIATTRPETMMGDTAIAVNPKDKRYLDLIGKSVKIPIVNRSIKIIADHYADPEQGSGAVKITPAHDFNDYEVGKRNKLELINIFQKNGKINKNGVKEFIGLDRFEARKILIAKLKENGNLLKIENINNKVPYGDRSNTIIEPLLTEQWFVNAKKLSKKPIEVVNKGKTSFFPNSWSKTFFQWMKNIEPWCISRQIWWGHRIPAWYDDNDNIFVAENEKQALILAKKKNKNKNLKLIQETDVLDTWFSSALWPFATLGWPAKTKELSKFYPTSVLVTGFDIIFFWVARMLMMGNYFNKKTPFKKVYVHALVRDEKGQKMSKSKGNVIDPLELIKEYGADSLRFTLISMASPGRDVKLSKDRVTGNRNFITKIWSANNFLKLNNCKLDRNIDIKQIKSPINQWIFNEYTKTQNLVSRNIEIFRFDEAAKHAYQFVWHLYCDWYLEFLKPIFNSKNKLEVKEAKIFATFMMANILRMLHPFIPFFTEFVWSSNSYKKVFKNDLISSNWPTYKSLRKFNQNQIIINDIIELISNIRSTKAELKITPKLFCDISFSNKSKNLKKIINKNLDLIKQVGRINGFIKNEQNKKNAIDILVLKEKLTLRFSEDIDISSQKEQILKKIDTIKKQVLGLNYKLKNKDYVNKAPEEIVLKDKKLIKELTIEEEKLRSIVLSIN